MRWVVAFDLDDELIERANMTVVEQREFVRGLATDMQSRFAAIEGVELIPDLGRRNDGEPLSLTVECPTCNAEVDVREARAL